MHTRVFAPGADAADPDGLSETPAHIVCATAVDLLGDPSDPGAACRPKPTPLVAVVDAPPGSHQMPPAHTSKPGTSPTGSSVRSEPKSSRVPHIDPAILRLIAASFGTKVVELQSMSLMNDACGPHRVPGVIGRPMRRDARKLRCQSRDWLGTFWAHSVSTEVNSGESHSMSFRSSLPVRLRDQHPETGSISGSSSSWRAGHCRGL